ncbi:MAG: hypothetical protein KKD74_13155 [Bacteroidetes bacterium]|nr:hypothetical protein [Bacteroidota bacterium]
MVVFGIICVLLLSYLLLIRPWHLHWGATKQEVMSAMPGDGIVPKPDFNATRGIGIRYRNTFF